MKKTLLAVAAALAASVITSQAQVYSQNIVGYYNQTIPTHNFFVVDNQLNLDGTNSVNNIFGGLFSDVNDATNTAIYLWNPSTSQYQSYNWFSGPDADNYFLIGPGSPSGFYDAGGNEVSATNGLGHSVFLQNRAAVSVTVTMVGGLLQANTNLVSFPGNGFFLVGSPVPVAADLVTNLGFVGYSDPAGAVNDAVYIWNPSTSQFQSFKYFAGPDADNYFLIGPGSPNGFYDAGGNLQSVKPLVGSGFFIQHNVGSAETWTNVLNIQ